MPTKVYQPAGHNFTSTKETIGTITSHHITSSLISSKQYLQFDRGLKLVLSVILIKVVVSHGLVKH